MNKKNINKNSRVAIVTGGTKNIGLAVCKALLKNNIKVAIVGLTELEKLKLRNEGYGKQVEDPTTIGKDFETGIMILKEIATKL